MTTKERVVGSLWPRSKKEHPGPLLQGKAGLSVEDNVAQSGGWGRKGGRDSGWSPSPPQTPMSFIPLSAFCPVSCPPYAQRNSWL